MNQSAAKNMQALMETYQKSGLGPTKFAAREGIRLNQLKYWIKKLKKEKASSSNFIQINPCQSYPANDLLEVHYPNGVKIKLAKIDLPLLSQLVSIY